MKKMILSRETLKNLDENLRHVKGGEDDQSTPTPTPPGPTYDGGCLIFGPPKKV